MSRLSHIFRRSGIFWFRWKHPPCMTLSQSCRSTSNDHHSYQHEDLLDEAEVVNESWCEPDPFTEKTVSRDRERQRSLYQLPPDHPADSQILNVAIIGGPNAGKSTLVNDLLCRKVNAVSSKVNTTRKNTISAFTDDKTQIVFVDTPGLFVPHRRKKLNLDDKIGRDPERCLKDADIVGVVVDVMDKWTRLSLHDEVVKLLHLYRHLPSFLILNKIDGLKSKETLLQVTRKLSDGIVAGVKIGSKAAPMKSVKKKNPRYDTLFNELEESYGSIQLTAKTEIALNRNKNTNNVTGIDDFVAGGSRTVDASNDVKEIDLIHGTFVDLDNLASNEADVDDCNTSIQEDIDKYKHKMLHKEQHAQHSRMLNMEKNKVENILEHVNPGADAGDEGTDIGAGQVGDREVQYVEQLERLKEAKLAILNNKGWPHFDHVFMVSALLGQQTGDIKEYLVERAMPGPWKYHSCMVTQQDTFEIAKCKVWEAVLEHVAGIIPYEVTLSISYWSVVENNDLMVMMEINVPKKHYLISVIGNKGDTIRKISHAAEQALMDVFHCNVILQLEVKSKQMTMKRHGARHYKPPK